MPTLYIHAGMHQTGTSALQSFLAHNRELLAQRLHLYYPTTGVTSPSRYAHHELFPIRQEVWGRLAEEASAFRGCDIVLSEERISRNNFQDFLPSNLAVIHHAFPGYAVKLIVYVRRLDDFIKSFFNQRTKGGYITAYSYSEFFQQIYNGEDGTLFFSHPLSTAVDLMGKENVLFRLYDRTLLYGGDIISDFFALLGLEAPEDAQPAPHTNHSLPNTALPFLSKTLLPPRLGGTLRSDIVALLRQVYAFPKGSGVGDDHLAEFEEEIDRIDAYVPGYKNLFVERRLSFSFPEVDVKDPQALFLAALLYRLLLNQQNGDSAETNIKTCPKRLVSRIYAALRIIRNRCALLKKKIFSRGA